MTRKEALALPNTETTLNGRCVGQLRLEDGATVLVLVYCAPWCEHQHG